MTLYVLEQLSILQDFGVAPPHDMVARALRYVESELPRHLKKDEAAVSYLAYGSYVLTSWDPAEVSRGGAAARRGAAVDEVRARQPADPDAVRARVVRARRGAPRRQARRRWSCSSRRSTGPRRDPVVGVYWTPERYSWMWYSDTVEKHAFFLRTLAELKPNDQRVPGHAAVAALQSQGQRVALDEGVGGGGLLDPRPHAEGRVAVAAAEVPRRVGQAGRDRDGQADRGSAGAAVSGRRAGAT